MKLFHRLLLLFFQQSIPLPAPLCMQQRCAKTLSLAPWAYDLSRITPAALTRSRSFSFSIVNISRVDKGFDEYPSGQFGGSLS
ncbi:hypothetical protein C8J56DRAFT_929424 [Mycena floridula]|nr:hypothetical protein C8J56DRAFT_929424 [Mycena floridula]